HPAGRGHRCARPPGGEVGMADPEPDAPAWKAAPRPWRWNPSQVALALLLALEVALFAAIGTNFFSIANGFEVLRLSVEVGLLALALTPVIVGGGVDLSVGSLMGLAAVVFGKLWRDAGLPIPVAVALTLALGALAGGLN